MPFHLTHLLELQAIVDRQIKEIETLQAEILRLLTLVDKIPEPEYHHRI